MRGVKHMGAGLLALTVLSATGRPASAVDIDVAQYGSSTSGFPYAVALEKGFFKEAGADVDGILGTIGGGSDVRNLVAAGLPYADVALPSAISAIQQGADIVMVSESSQNAASLVLVTMPNSSITSVKDLKGKRMGFSSPQSFTQAAESLMLDRAGYKHGDVIMVATGGFGPGLTALEHGGVDITVSTLPDLYLHPDKYKPVIWARDVLPPIANTVGVIPRNTSGKQADMVRAIIVARRKAVAYMASNRDESAAIIGKVYKIDTVVARKIIDQLIDQGKIEGIPYWGPGNFDFAGMDNMIAAGRAVGMIRGDVDVKKMIDETYLPSDLQSK